MTDRNKPEFTVIYDGYVEQQAKLAFEVYTNLLPGIATSRVRDVIDEDLLEQLSVAERILSALSTSFEIVNKEDTPLHEFMANAPRRDTATVAQIASTFNYLYSLLNHPVFFMLTSMRGVLEKRKPVASLRDIRWIYKADNSSLIFKNETVLFNEFTALLRAIATPTNTYCNHPIAKQALADFEGFIYDEDGSSLINKINIGTAIAIAQSTAECIRKH